jgi:hypothetical protein
VAFEVSIKVAALWGRVDWELPALGYSDSGNAIGTWEPDPGAAVNNQHRLTDFIPSASGVRPQVKPAAFLRFSSVNYL